METTRSNLSQERLNPLGSVAILIVRMFTEIREFSIQLLQNLSLSPDLQLQESMIDKNLITGQELGLVFWF